MIKGIALALGISLLGSCAGQTQQVLDIELPTYRISTQIGKKYFGVNNEFNPYNFSRYGVLYGFDKIGDGGEPGRDGNADLLVAFRSCNLKLHEHPYGMLEQTGVNVGRLYLLTEDGKLDKVIEGANQEDLFNSISDCPQDDPMTIYYQKMLEESQKK